MADLADAQRRAESALRRVLANAATIIRLSWSDGATAADRRNLERIKTAAADIAQDHKILRALLAAAREAESALATERRRREEAEGKFNLMADPFFALAAELMPLGSVDEARTNPAAVLPYLEAWFERLKEAEERLAAPKAAPPQPETDETPDEKAGRAFVERQKADRAACPMGLCGESFRGCACEGACLACHAAAPAESWPDRYERELREVCRPPSAWEPCSAPAWIETMVSAPGWVCGACGHGPGHPRHADTAKPRGFPQPAPATGEMGSAVGYVAQYGGGVAAQPIPGMDWSGTTGTVGPQPAPAKGEEDEGHYEFGLRLQIAQANGDIPSADKPNPTWAAWAQRLLADALAYRELPTVPHDPVSAPPTGDCVREAAEELVAGFPAFKDPCTPEELGVAGNYVHVTVGQVRRLRAALSAAPAGPAPALTEAVREAKEAFRLEMQEAYWIDDVEHFGVRATGAKLLAALDAAQKGGR